MDFLIIIPILIIAFVIYKLGKNFIFWLDFRSAWKASEKNRDDFRIMVCEWSKQ